MLLIETQILQNPIIFVDCVNSFEREFILGFAMQSKWSPAIVEHKLAILGLRESE